MPPPKRKLVKPKPVLVVKKNLAELDSIFGVEQRQVGLSTVPIKRNDFCSCAYCNGNR